jgi:hypothetical protein
VKLKQLQQFVADRAFSVTVGSGKKDKRGARTKNSLCQKVYIPKENSFEANNALLGVCLEKPAPTRQMVIPTGRKQGM